MIILPHKLRTSDTNFSSNKMNSLVSVTDCSIAYPFSKNRLILVDLLQLFILHFFLFPVLQAQYY
jgi:hypothetical protein